jgi:hypothetical protein
MDSNLISTKYERPSRPLLSLNVRPISELKLSFKWLETVNLLEPSENDYLTKFKIIYKLVSNDLSEANHNNLDNINEIVIDYKNTSKMIVNADNVDSFDYDDDEIEEEGSDFGLVDLKSSIIKDQINLIQHKMTLDISGYMIETANATYEFSICPINLIGDSLMFKCSLAKTLTYMNDREPDLRMG